LTDKEMSDIISDMVIISDTREQKNQHILSYLDENNVQYLVDKLDTADYSFVLPHYPHLNLDRKILIEKKNSLDEIAGNFTKGRERFAREFERVQADEVIHLVIENATWRKLNGGSYRSKFPSKSFMASILTYSIRYNCKVWFAQPQDSPSIIYNLMKYELLERLKSIRGGV